MKRWIRNLYYWIRKKFQAGFNFFESEHRLVIVEANSWNDIREIWCQILTPQKFVGTIRIGGEADGGYCTPNVLSTIDAFFSPGYGGIKLFEDDLQKWKIETFICDGGFQFINDLKTSQNFTPKYLSTFDSDEFISLETWIRDSNFRNSSNLGLQMDIEGAEYEILSAINYQILRRFKLLLIEFHDLDLLFVSQAQIQKLKNIVYKISQSHYLVHVKSNNAGGSINVNGYAFPKVLELSFIRKELANFSEGDFHMHCPYLNDPSKPPIKLPQLL